MTKPIKPEYFYNRKEQLQIEEAIINAIQPGMYYHNIVCALANQLSYYTRRMVLDETRGDAPGIKFEGGDDRMTSESPTRG